MRSRLSPVVPWVIGHSEYRPYGKFAATFVDLKAGDAVRVAVVEKKRTDKTGPEAMKEAVGILREAPEADLFRIRRVKLVISEGDMPGMPKFKARCSKCNEMIVDNKEVMYEGDVLCGNCAGVPYYTDLE